MISTGSESTCIIGQSEANIGKLNRDFQDICNVVDGIDGDSTSARQRSSAPVKTRLNRLVRSMRSCESVPLVRGYQLKNEGLMLDKILIHLKDLASRKVESRMTNLVYDYVGDWSAKWGGSSKPASRTCSRTCSIRTGSVSSRNGGDIDEEDHEVTFLDEISKSPCFIEEMT